MSPSLAEAEHPSIAMTTCELKWLKEILTFLRVEHVQPMQLCYDSQAALHIA